MCLKAEHILKLLAHNALKFNGNVCYSSLSSLLSFLRIFTSKCKHDLYIFVIRIEILFVYILKNIFLLVCLGIFFPECKQVLTAKLSFYYRPDYTAGRHQFS